jgi:uncharacterized protein (DUF2062 family)
MDLRDHLPTREQLRNTRSLKFLGNVIFEPNLWHFNRHSLSYAFLLGGICFFLPIPFQSIPCLVLCAWIRCNVPVAVAIVWISNPITMGPMMYFAYRLGSWMLGHQPEITLEDPSFEWFTEQLSVIWQPLLLGSLTAGTTIGLSGFIAVRIYYRIRITRYLQRKKQQRKQKQRKA